MTPEEQRIAIAEACGWKWNHLVNGWTEILNREGELVSCEKPFRGKNFPNYLSDLNAMHEAEKVLTDKQRAMFMHHVATITGWDRDVKGLQAFADYSWSMIHATAAQRAEAFLRTLGKWKE